MEYPDRLPVTLNNKQFPMGDIDVSRKDEMIDQWINEVSDYPYDRFKNYINYASRTTSMDNTATCDNHRVAIELCHRWDKERGDDHRFAVTGFLITRAFLNETRLLPKFDRDMTHELDEMRIKNPKGAQAFGKAAWLGMETSHPLVFMQHDKILDMSHHRYDLHSDEDREYFIAGMVLPYMMAAITRLEGYNNVAGITGMKVGTVEELEAMEFPRIFTSNI